MSRFKLYQKNKEPRFYVDGKQAGLVQVCVALIEENAELNKKLKAIMDVTPASKLRYQKVNGPMFDGLNDPLRELVVL